MSNIIPGGPNINNTDNNIIEKIICNNIIEKIKCDEYEVNLIYSKEFLTKFTTGFFFIVIKDKNNIYKQLISYHNLYNSIDNIPNDIKNTIIDNPSIFINNIKNKNFAIKNFYEFNSNHGNILDICGLNNILVFKVFFKEYIDLGITINIPKIDNNLENIELKDNNMNDLDSNKKTLIQKINYKDYKLNIVNSNDFINTNLSNNNNYYILIQHNNNLYKLSPSIISEYTNYTSSHNSHIDKNIKQIIFNKRSCIVNNILNNNFTIENSFDNFNNNENENDIDILELFDFIPSIILKVNITEFNNTYVYFNIPLLKKLNKK